MTLFCDDDKRVVEVEQIILRVLYRFYLCCVMFFFYVIVICGVSTMKAQTTKVPL